MKTELTITPPKGAEDLADGTTQVAILIYSILLRPCNSILFRMFLGAATNKFQEAGIQAEWAGLFGEQFAMCCAEVSDKASALNASIALVSELNIKSETCIGYFDPREGAWRMVHSGIGLNLRFAEFFSKEKRDEFLEIVEEEKRFIQALIAIAKRKASEQRGDNPAS